MIKANDQVGIENATFVSVTPEKLREIATHMEVMSKSEAFKKGESIVADFSRDIVFFWHPSTQIVLSTSERSPLV